MGLAMDSLVNPSAKFWYISNARGSVPLVVRSAVGGGGRFAAVRSQAHGRWCQGVPGRKIAFPSFESVARTNRLLAVEEGSRTGGWAAGLLVAVAERALHDLDDPWIVATDETPIPYSPTLEDAYIPDTEAVVASVRARAGVGVSA
jgi:pyruvate/2-oxoglutarate/acetoin dehydrogenase E1 component